MHLRPACRDAKKTLCVARLGAPPYTFGQATKYCSRLDPNGPNQTLNRSVDALTTQGLVVRCFGRATAQCMQKGTDVIRVQLIRVVWLEFVCFTYSFHGTPVVVERLNEWRIKH
jgi:hypothetical protein